MHRVFAIVGLFFLLVALDAPACHTVRRAVVVQAQAQAAVVLTPILAVPAYSVSYDPNIGIIVDELRKLREEVVKLRGSPATPALDFKAVVAAKCANCHTDGKQKLGGEFVLLEKDGTLPALSLPERRRIQQLIDSGHMPPAKSGIVLTQDEKSVLKSGLTKEK